MQSIQEELGSQIKTIAISVDSVEDTRRLIARKAFEFSFVSDSELSMIDAFKLRHVEGVPGQDIARPAMFLVDREGVVRHRWLTDNYRVRVLPEQILEAARQLD